jgi:hypothetical protein
MFTVTGLDLEPVKTNDPHYPRGVDPGGYGLHPGDTIYIKVNNVRNYLLQLDTWSVGGVPVDCPLDPPPTWDHVQNGSRFPYTVIAPTEGNYKYCIYLDGNMVDDPEIVIDSMLRDGRKREEITLAVSEVTVVEVEAAATPRAVKRSRSAAKKKPAKRKPAAKKPVRKKSKPAGRKKPARKKAGKKR